MRPQRFSCGIRSYPSSQHRHHQCFNEAAAFQLRNPPSSSWPSDTPSRFNEAAAFQLRNRSERLVCRTRSPCFNEAAAFQLRNRRCRRCPLSRFRRASMRPQRFSCGIRADTDRQLQFPRASMRPQRFSCGIDRAARSGRLLEWAASMRPQRFSCGIR